MEETLLALFCAPLTSEKVPASASLPPPLPLLQGLGNDELMRQVRWCSWQHRNAQGPLMCPLACIRALQGPVCDVHCWLVQCRGVERPHTTV